MADKKMSELTVVPQLKTTALIPVVQDGLNYTTTPAQITAGLGGSTKPKSTPQNLSTGIIIPMYIYPSDIFTNIIYDNLIFKIRQSDVPVIIILNPSSGPGVSADGNYTEAINRLQGAGAVVIGYVSTLYAARSQVLVQNDVIAWKTFYPKINGIFFDEMTYSSSPSSNVTYYQNLRAMCSNLGVNFVVNNPGSPFSGAYFDADVADLIIGWESDLIPTDAQIVENFSGGMASYDLVKRGFLLHSHTVLDQVLLDKLVKYYGWIYVTEQPLVTAWNTISKHIDDLIRKFNKKPTSISPQDVVMNYTFRDISDQPFNSASLTVREEFDWVGGTFSGGVFTKVGNPATWNTAKLWSKTAIGPGSSASGVATSGTFYIGVCEIAPGTGYTNSTGFYFKKLVATLEVWYAGSYVGVSTPWVIGDVMNISYDGNSLVAKKNTTTIHSIVVGVGKKYYFDSDFYENGAAANTINYTTPGVIYSNDLWPSLVAFSSFSGLGTITAQNGALRATSDTAGIFGNSIWTSTVVTSLFCIKLKTSAEASVTLEFRTAGVWGASKVLLAKEQYKYFGAVVPIASTGFRLLFSGVDIDIDYVYLGDGKQNSSLDLIFSTPILLEGAAPCRSPVGEAVEFFGKGYGKIEQPKNTKSISFWFKVPSTQNTGYTMLISGGQFNSALNLWYVGIGNVTNTLSDESIAFHVFNSTGNLFMRAHYRAGHYLLADDNWHNMTINFSGAISISLDGISLPLYFLTGSLSSDVSSIISKNPMYISRYIFNNTDYPTCYSGVYFYDRQLKSDDVFALYSKNRESNIKQDYYFGTRASAPFLRDAGYYYLDVSAVQSRLLYFNGFVWVDTVNPNHLAAANQDILKFMRQNVGVNKAPVGWTLLTDLQALGL